jgi:predicted aminopeptidase
MPCNLIHVQLCRMLLLAGAIALLGACASMQYATQAWQGNRELLRMAVPIEQLLEDPALDPALAARLQLALDARRFASDELRLPDNASYTRYAALPRPFVLWNVFVTPELSMEPVQHCFLFAGCLAYRGYFDDARARQAADEWRARGKDVHLGGVPAYSTLGWYEDPLVSSMLHWDDDYLLELIFHELAHQQFYARDDTAFNESYATFVGRQGVDQWRARQNLPPRDQTLQRRQQDLTLLMLTAREELSGIFESGLSEDAKRLAKAERFDRLRADYRTMRDTQWEGDRRFDGWMEGELNNASLLPFGLYDQWVPAFAELFRSVGDDWARFHERVAELGRSPAAERESTLRQLHRTARQSP